MFDKERLMFFVGMNEYQFFIFEILVSCDVIFFILFFIYYVFL
jgi:hypothetical protein